jgi:hypothetical protein
MMLTILLIILAASTAVLWMCDSGPLRLWDSGWWLVVVMLGVVGFVCSLCGALAIAAMALVAMG